MTDQNRIFDFQSLQDLGERREGFKVHELRIASLLLKHVRLPIAVAVVNERAAAGCLGDAGRKIPPLPDRAEAFVEKDQRPAGAGAPNPFIGERMAGRFHRWHPPILPALRASSASSSR